MSRLQACCHLANKYMYTHTPTYIHASIYTHVPQSRTAQGEVLDGGAGRLAVHQVAVHERVLEEGNDRVDVVLPHLVVLFELRLCV